MIRAGRITVDHCPVSSPEFQLDPETSVVALDGQEIGYKKFRYFMMNKPSGILTEDVDTLLPEELSRLRLFPVGRLDKDTTGLLLLTNDGDYAHRVISPKYEVWKCYEAETEGIPDEKDAAVFAGGIPLSDFTCLPAELIPSGGNTCRVLVREGKYHQVKRMLGYVGKPVLHLHRLSIGALQLKSELEPGFVCEISQEEADLVFLQKQQK